MCVLQTDSGDILHETSTIVQEVKSFYENLYRSREHEVVNVSLSELNVESVLSDEESTLLDGPISMQETLSALKQMKNDKSPGSEGYIAEFFLLFFSDLGVFLTRSINNGFEKNEMSVTQRQGVITCIPKEGKDKSFIKNWRPITLLNTVYKIASSCIANRIKRVLPQLIGEQQTGFLKGRFIGDNLRLLYDTIVYCENKNIPGMLFMADQEKAFDSVAWSFIDKCLCTFNFGPDMRHWIFTFYNNIKSCVCVNGQYSSWFEVQRGTRQGDPVSPYIFFYCVQKF